MQDTVFQQKKQTLYTFADKLQSAVVVRFGPMDPRNGRGISLVDRFEYLAWETSSTFRGDDRGSVRMRSKNYLRECWWPLEGADHGRYKSLLMEKRLLSDIVERDYVAIEVERLDCQEGILRCVTDI